MHCSRSLARLWFGDFSIYGDVSTTVIMIIYASLSAEPLSNYRSWSSGSWAWRTRHSYFFQSPS
jgi:hypothetical protein